ncbi:MAG: large-conductance mechanosensitive channel protein MscL [Firmicutes bacterium]|nr:large-conductance mechanosensitive channel protein MscL [Bacillota bacterium]
MKKLFAEFKEFIARGNVMDLAVGMIIGAAFTAIVGSLVNDIVMPFIGWLIGGMDFTKFAIKLSEEASINYGTFIQNIINFLLIAVVVFILVKGLNKLKKKKEEEPKPDPEPSDEVKLLTEIRDALKKE